MANEIIVYGSLWCGYTTHAMRTLNKLGVAYRYIDVDESPEDEKRIAAWNNGRSIRPTIDIGGAIFVNPDDNTLLKELKQRDLLMSDDAAKDALKPR